MRTVDRSYQARPASRIDLSGILDCERQAFDLAGSSEVFPEVLPSQVRSGLVQIVCINSIVVGYISYSVLTSHIFVDALAILPSHHRRGLGRQLLGFAEGEAARLGLATVDLYTDGDVAGNCAFYRRCGYRETDRCLEPGLLRVFYSKTIAA